MAISDAEKREVRDLYRRLAAKWKWPATAWEGDKRTIAEDPENALMCLRNLVKEQGA